MEIVKKQTKMLVVSIASLLLLSVFLGGCGSKPAADTSPPAADTPPSILWLNGTYAILTKANECDVYVFGGMKSNMLNKQIMLASLDEWWGLTNKEEMDEMIDSLVVGRHNPMFLEEIEEYGIIDMSKSEFDEALQDVDDRLDVLYFQNMFDAYQRFGEKAIMGWDLSRAVQLCADGYIAGFYTYEEATDKARKIGVIIQNTFDSWDDFFASYFHGYAYWSDDDIEDANSEYTARMKILNELKNDDKSPLNLDWDLDLSA